MASDRRRLLRIGAPLVALAVLVAAEGVARLVETRAGSRAWGNKEFSIRFDQLEAISETGHGVDVAFLGSSMLATALDPQQFVEESCCLDSAYNASILAMGGRTLEMWAKEVVIPLANPPIVVIGLSSRAVNDNGMNQQSLDELYRSSPGRSRWIGDDSLADAIEDTLIGWSALVRTRSVLRDPAATMASLVRPETVGRYGDQLRPWRDRSFTLTPAFRENIETRVLNEYSLGSIDSVAIERTIHWLVEHDIDVYLVDMPVTPDLIEMHPRGTLDFEAYRKWLVSTASNTDAVLLSLPDQPWETEFFADPDHLNGEGTARFTSWLAKELTATNGPARAP